MKSLFDTEYCKEIVDRIWKLNAHSKSQWGKMTVSQMVTHAQAPFKVAFEELKLKRGIVGILFGGAARRQLTGPEPFKRNLPTDKNFIIKGHPEFEKERNNLINYVHQFSNAGPSGITKEPHPFFGKLTPHEWDLLMVKHLDHHLRQFGA